METKEGHCTVGERTVSFLESGGPGGVPCLFVHGSPGCRLQALRLRKGVERHPVRLVAPDRPGCGGTSPTTGHSFDDSTGDIEAVLDFLGISAAPLLAVSGGVAAALAAASELPERISRVVLASGLGLLTRREHLKGVSPFNRAVMVLARRGAAVVRPALLPPVLAARFVPVPGRAASAANRERLTALAAETKETFRQGTTGPARDLALASRVETLDLSSIRQPVKAWHGSEDRHAPLGAMAALVDRLPRAELRVFEGHDHFVFETHADELLSEVLSPG